MSINYEALSRAYWRAKHAAEDFAAMHFSGKFIATPVDHKLHGKAGKILDPAVPRTLREIYAKLVNRRVQAYNVYAKARGWPLHNHRRLGCSRHPIYVEFPKERTWTLTVRGKLGEDQAGGKGEDKTEFNLKVRFNLDPETGDVKVDPNASIDPDWKELIEGKAEVYAERKES